MGIFDEFFGKDCYERRIPYLHYGLSQVEEAFSIFEDSTTEGEVRYRCHGTKREMDASCQW